MLAVAGGPRPQRVLLDTERVLELDDFRQQLRLLGAALTVEEQIGRALLDEYKHVLQR